MGDYDALTLGLGLLINTTELYTHNRITLSTAFLPSGACRAAVIERCGLDECCSCWWWLTGDDGPRR